MKTSLEHHPECLGFIDLHYSTECHGCKYAAMCAYIVVVEKWPGPKYRKTNDNEMFPIGDRDDKSEEEDTKKT